LNLHVRLGYLIVALSALLLLLALGRAVDMLPDPEWIMRFEAAWVNHSTLVAWWLTWLGWGDVLIPLCVALVFVAMRFPQWRWRIAISIVSLLLSWQGATYLQILFMRPRRLDWVVKHETAFSYPSSHAAIVAGFYWLWALLVSRSSLPHKAIVSAALWLLGLGVLWSRLALGAHYITDVAGGVLWGIVVVAALAAILPINVLERPRSASLE
jgi:membrane-associated phospholipid phosphatase